MRLHTEPVGVPASFGGVEPKGPWRKFLQSKSGDLTYEAITSAIFAKTLNFDGDVCSNKSWQKELATTNRKPSASSIDVFHDASISDPTQSKEFMKYVHICIY